ncbi:YidC/Oxa1 family membrane protein insertase [Streptosporangium saharense]|uniref:YidC/Oxa1 family membrane protein insertase n=1 Tax=Streptosporangium saharense TaxID=1706840 RepID=UPI0034271F17
MFDSVIGFTADLIDLLAQPLGSAALAIVVFTVCVRVLLLPFGVMQARGARAQAALAPRLAELRKRHGKDPARLYRETNALYTAEGVSPFGGFLPALAQLPVLMVVYRVFVSSTIAGHANALLTHGLFGVQLGQHLAGTVAGFGLVSGPTLVFACLFLLLAAVAALTSRRMRLTPVEGPGSGMLRRVMPLLPFMTVLAAAVLPLAAGIYLLVTTAWTAAERAVLYRAAPAAV